VSLPLVIPNKNDPADLQVCMADAGGFLRLLRGNNLNEIRSWNLAGTDKITGRVSAGPFLRGNQILCVVNHRRLVSIDWNQDKPAWEYQSKGGVIVGPPELIDDMIVVTDATGRVVGLEPATGKETKPGGFHLSANVAPTASPVPFDKNRAFVPLTDGTVFFLSLSQIRPAASN
jgi:outer membrane protein assembly factor BamB